MESKERSKCPNCKEVYNSTVRQLIILPCCDEVCLDCYEKLLQPQDDKLFCPECKEEIKIPPKFKAKITKIKEYLPDIKLDLNIYCDTHDNCPGDFYCKKHKTFVCLKCAFNNHSDHKAEISDVKFGEISSYCDRVLNKLISFKNRIESAIEEVQKVKMKELSYKSAQFFDLINEVSSILTPHSTQKQELNDLQFLQDQQIPPNLIPQQQLEAVEPLQFDQHTQETFSITAREQQLLKQWIGGNTKFELLYRSSRDGLTPDKFHSLCDDKGATLCIIKSNQGKVFGGYASVPWKSNGCNQADSEAFLFSLTHLTKHPQYQNHHEAVYHSRTEFCSFGSNLMIQSPPTESLTLAFGSTYRLPDGLKLDSDEAKNYLAGKANFFPSAIEVYQVIFQ